MNWMLQPQLLELKTKRTFVQDPVHETTSCPPTIVARQFQQANETIALTVASKEAVGAEMHLVGLLLDTKVLLVVLNTRALEIVEDAFPNLTKNLKSMFRSQIVMSLKIILHQGVIAAEPYAQQSVDPAAGSVLGVNTHEQDVRHPPRGPSKSKRFQASIDSFFPYCAQSAGLKPRSKR